MTLVAQECGFLGTSQAPALLSDVSELPLVVENSYAHSV